jgi:beta-ribofuranosylaminobenzene 5'-phosphate synthase
LNNHEISFTKLGEILGRGGTSGLGINLIKTGGFILEGGHSTKDKRLFQPSSSVKKVLAAPVLARYEPNWGVLLILPKYERVFGEKERNFFSKICPINERDIEKLARITLSKLLPAVAENDLGSFCEGINLIQERTWKKSEIGLHDEKINELMKKIMSIDNSLGVGMSSIGPLIYIFGENIKKVQKVLKVEDLEIIKITKIKNSGIKISTVEE